MKIERRKVQVDFKVEERNGTTTFVGTPIVYNKRSLFLGFYEIISSRAATQLLNDTDIVLLYGHNDSTLLPIARNGSTMSVTEDDTGIHIAASSPETQFAKDLEISIRRGDVKDMSFAFAVAEGDDIWEKRDDNIYRTINKFSRIFDFSYVAYGAYSDTSVALRAFERFTNSVIADNNNDEIVIENENIEAQLLINRYGV
jgi:hypothetical protein